MAMFRNGTDFGIRVSGTGDAWFTAPVEMPQGLYFPGFAQADANPDRGGSTIVTSGWDCVAGVLTATECWLTAHHSAGQSKEAPDEGAKNGAGADNAIQREASRLGFSMP